MSNPAAWARVWASVAALVSATYSSAARADISSWLYLGFGPGWLKTERSPTAFRTTLEVEAGVGTPPTRALVAGGLFRLHSRLGEGSELGLMARLATAGFAAGSWGAALDAGPYLRSYGVGSTGGRAALVLGAPWGLTLSVGGGLGTHESRDLTVTFGVDLARLTVVRQSGLGFFPNPRSNE